MNDEPIGKSSHQASSIRKSPSVRRTELLFLAPDDAPTRSIVEALVADYAIRIVPSPELLRSALASRGADLVILDCAAGPEADIVELCRAIRLTSSVGIIVLVDPDEPERRVRALEAGADDCFSRRPGAAELRARVQGLVRRAGLVSGEMTRFGSLRFANWLINPQSRLLVNPQGRNVDLTAAEFDLLWAFCRNSGRTLSRALLLTFTRVGSARPIERCIDVHVSRLRAKIEDDPHHPVFLRTVRLGGYVFTPEIDCHQQAEETPD